MNRADAWRDKGRYFSWSPRSGDASEVQVFHVELGDAGAPPLVLVHGFPTSSIDWVEVAERLSDRYRVCAMDFPGFGFSDKPLGWGYNLMRDAEVLEYYVADVLGLESMILYAHDRGSSVAMIHTTNGESRVNLEHLFITNANIFLPMSNLTRASCSTRRRAPRCSPKERRSSSRRAWAKRRTRHRAAPTTPRSKR
jgi:pimeloyl-ACP methyl ester carboxylesterase